MRVSVRIRRWFRLVTLALTTIALAISACLPVSLASLSHVTEFPAGVDRETLSASATMGIKRFALDTLARSPMRFEACSESGHAQFLARMKDTTVYVSADEATFLLRTEEGVARLGRVADLGSPRNARSPQANEQLPEPRRDRAAPRPNAVKEFRMQLIGANRRARVAGEEPSPTRTSYFIGKDSTQWRTDVPSYSRVRVEQVYRGVDIVYYGSGQQLEYDFKVAPQADFKAIRLRFDGARRIRLDENGDLVIESPGTTLRHRKPVAYQITGGMRCEVAARYILARNGEVTFNLGSHDNSRPLVIDPVLTYATYFSSPTGGETIKAVAFDAAGSAYVIGNALSSLLPTTPGAVQPVNPASAVFVARLNAAGSGVLYCTYLGGSGGEQAAGIAVDRAGNAYVTGATASRDFPTTANAFQRARGDYRHPFISKLNATGTALVYSTYVGGKEENAAGTGIAVDAGGQATITGYTDSRRFPTTANAPQPENAGSFDAFVARLNSDGSGLAYATYLGGNSSDMARAIALDVEGNAYVAGDTYSKDFPTTRGAYKRDSDGTDISFVAKVTATGDKLVYSTYISALSIPNGIATDAAGNAYLTGYSILPNLRTTPGSLQPASAGGVDAFVVKLSGSGSDLLYSTYLGGSGADSGNAIAVDSIGQAYVTGNTTSVDFPLVQPVQSRKRGGPLFRSTDRGDSWDDLPAISASLNSLVVDPRSSSTLYGATSNSVIKSTDSGASWRVLIDGVNAVGFRGALVIDPTDSARLYLLSDRSVYRSADDGENWQRVDLPIPSFHGISSMVIDPKSTDTLYLAAEQFAVPGDGDLQQSDVPLSDVMFKSTDRGASWVPLKFGIEVSSVNALAIDHQTPSTLFAATDTFNTGLLKSTNGGATWFKVNGNLFVRRVVVAPTNANVLYGSTFNDVIKSTDGGASWRQTSLENVFINRLTIDPRDPSTLYVNAFTGVHQTTDGGTTWRKTLNVRYGNSIGFDPSQPSVVYLTGSITDDMFVAKLNATGTALAYSTYLGGFEPDYGQGIAADAYGNAVAVGYSYSTNFPVTPGAYQDHGTIDITGIIVHLADPIALRITGASIKGKKLLVTGQGFHNGAVIVLNGTDLETQSDARTPATVLISRRGGKQIAQGQTVGIRVRDVDGRLSNEFTFTRGAD